MGIPTFPASNRIDTSGQSEIESGLGGLYGTSKAADDFPNSSRMSSDWKQAGARCVVSEKTRAGASKSPQKLKVWHKGRTSDTKKRKATCSGPFLGTNGSGADVGRDISRAEEDKVPNCPAHMQPILNVFR